LRDLEGKAARLASGPAANAPPERLPRALPERPPEAPPDAARRDGDFLRAAWERPELDIQQHVIERTAKGLIMLNRYPYANGHLLVALGAAKPALLDYSQEERAALWALVDRAVDLCQRTLRPHGVNIGINQGSAAGAGVPNHLHAHVVPRWTGDTNFISVVGEVRVIPDALESMASAYRAAAAG
jgi:ATP adenylyltransferase